MGSFTSNVSVLTDSVIEEVQQILAFYPYSDSTRTKITSDIEEPPCTGCQLTTWCRTSKECCKAFQNYVKNGQYLDQDIGTKIYAKRHGLA